MQARGGKSTFELEGATDELSIWENATAYAKLRVCCLIKKHERGPLCR